MNARHPRYARLAPDFPYYYLKIDSLIILYPPACLSLLRRGAGGYKIIPYGHLALATLALGSLLLP